MNKNQRTCIEEIYDDCCALERENQLSEYGAGMADLCIMLLGKKRDSFTYNQGKPRNQNVQAHYSIDDFQAIHSNRQLLLVAISMANELHEMNTALARLQATGNH